MTHAEDPSDDQLRACCAADAWLSRMSQARPFPSAKAALDLSDEIVLGLDDAALDQALAAHARIGERRLGSTTEDRWSRSEQAGALAVATDVQERLAEGNRRYEERFGHVFLIRAAGRTGAEILAELERRLGNEPEAERAETADNLRQIALLRLEGEL